MRYLNDVDSFFRNGFYKSMKAGEHRLLSYIKPALMVVLFSWVFCSCGDDGDSENQSQDPQQTELINKLITHKWYYSGYDVDFEETQRNSIYFFENGVGVTHFYRKSQWIGVEEEDETFTYKVTGLQVVVDYDHGDTFEYHYIDGKLYDINYFETYTPQNYTNKDFEYVKDFDPKEKEHKKEILESIKKNLQVEEYFDGYEYTYTFHKTLETIFPSSNIKYGIMFNGVCNQYKYCKKSYCKEHCWYKYVEKEQLKYKAYVYPVDGHDDYALYDMYLETKKNIEKKMQSGESLTESEKDLYRSIKTYLEDMQDNDYNAYPFVEIDDERFILEDYRF